MKYKHLTIEERETIQLMLWEKKSIRAIAEAIKRSPPSISREIKRNMDGLGRRRYSPRVAHERAMKKRKSRGREDRLKNERVRDYVSTHLKMKWSPEQIAGRIQIELNEKISHEAIYQYIYHQIHRDGYGYLKPGREDLRPYLRRKKKRRTHKGQRRCQRMFEAKGTLINERPLIINLKQRLGDWEGDTVESTNHKPGINTLVERKTGLVLISKLQGRTAKATLKAVTSRLSALPKEARQSLTTDNGSENTEWQTIEKQIDIKCFFCNPYHSWERGTNENTNGLIRDYFPKKTDFTIISQEELSEVEDLLNNRPRKRLGWLTPLEVFSKELNQFNITLKIPSVALVG